MELSSPRDDARATLEAILAKAMEDGIVDDAVIAANLSQRQAFWKLRDEMSAAQKPEGGSIKHDISVPVVAVPDFLAEADAAVVKLIPGSRPVPFGHLGDGNIHYNVSQPVGADAADFLARWHEVNKVVFDIVLQDGRLDLGRARHRRAQARRAARREGQDRDRADARVQGDARSQRHHESRQGAVSKQSKGPALTITSIEDGDVPEVVRLWKRAGLVREWNDPTGDIALARRERNSTILLGRDDGALVASVLVGHDGHRGWVYYVSVDPDHRLKDYGRQIMTAAEDWLRARGIMKLQLMVRGDNARVHAFYRVARLLRPEARRPSPNGSTAATRRRNRKQA